MRNLILTSPLEKKKKKEFIFFKKKITLIFKDKHVFKKNKQTPASKYKKGNFICNKK